MVDLGDLLGGDAYADASGVSADGSVVVGQSMSRRSSAGNTEAFRWTADSGMVGLGDLPGGTFASSAAAVSGNGRVAVGGGRTSEGNEAFRWTAETGMVGLGDLPGAIFNSWAFAASHDGSVVVGVSSGSGVGTEAFVWTEAHGMKSLRELLLAHGVTDVASWQITEARGVSADGRTIVGWGSGPSGHSAWVATIGQVPEPPAIAARHCWSWPAGLGPTAAPVDHVTAGSRVIM